MEFPTQDGKPARWRSVTGHKFTSTRELRSAEQLLLVTRQFGVTWQPRYQPTPIATYCNIYAIDVLEAMGVLAPRHWVDAIDGHPTPVGTGEELSANKLCTWFAHHGTEFCWSLASEEDARANAQAGRPSLALWRNPDPKHSGHVAVVIPDARSATYLAQAGRSNSDCVALKDIFGKLPVAFWVHA